MEPAIKDGQLYCVNYLHYQFSAYKTGNIITFRHENKIWVSRIEGLQNEAIKMTDNTILINNKISSDSIQINRQDFGDMAVMGLNRTAKIQPNHVYV